MKKILLSAVVLVTFTTASNAQATATATASAVIVTPITIAKATGGDLNFGNIATNGTGGTVVIATSGARSFGTQGGLTFPSVTGGPRQASFDVAGTALYTYAITLPGTVTLAHAVTPANTMDVASWVTDGTTNTTGVLSAGGADNLNIGATLTVGDTQLAGTYTNTTDLDITVNYN